MTSADSIINGIAKYVDNELVNKTQGYQKWLLGTYASILLSKGHELIHSVTENDLIKNLGLVDESGNVDIDTLYTELKKQAEKSNVTLQIPLVGNIILSSSDVDMLYNYIEK